MGFLTASLLIILIFSTPSNGQVENVRQIPTSSNSAAQATAPEPLPVTASLSLKDLILILITKHGNIQTSLAFNSLDNLPLGEVMRAVLGSEVDKPLASDIVRMQHHAQNSDKQLVSLIARIVTGDKTISNDIFEWDEKLRKFPWWARIRQRIFINLDKYVSYYKPELKIQQVNVSL